MINRTYIVNNRLIYFSFNQNNSCFCIGTEKGFTIYKSVPLNYYYSRELQGGISIISMFNKSNILAFVGGGKRPFAPLNQLIIWNDATSKVLGDISVDSKIIDVKIKDSLIAIILKKKIEIYYYDSLKNILNYKHIDTIPTPDNQSAIFGINLDPSQHIISYISKNIGEIIIKVYDENKEDQEINSKIKKILAHQSEVTYITLNYKGDLLASCSEKGTIIRLFSTNTGKLLKEFRRGIDYAEIYSINFDKTSHYLICGSSKGTIHIFNIKANKGPKNPKSFLNSLGSYLNIKNDYLKDEWSFAQMHIDVDGKYIVNFTEEDNTFIVLTEKGIYYRSKFSPSTGGECPIYQKKEYLFLEKNDDDFFF